MPHSRDYHRGTPARLILIRHGESVLGRAGRYAGHRDSPLSPRGRAQVLRLRPRFRRLRPDVIVSSDLARCRQTAQILAPGAEVLSSPELRELNFGRWDGRTAESCRRRDGRRFDQWMREPWSTRTPDGESLRQLCRRVRRFVTSLISRFPNRTLALITHAGPLRTLLATNPSDFWRVSVPPASLFELDWEPKVGQSAVREGRCGEG
jgi:alpha-ribazole phosphatase